MKLPDPRNNDIMVFVGDKLVPRAEARVSVFDSVVQGGDAVWEGLRVYDGRPFALDGLDVGDTTADESGADVAPFQGLDGSLKGALGLVGYGWHDNKTHQQGNSQRNHQRMPKVFLASFA